MHIHEVGKPYAERRRWPEGADYNYRNGCHEFRLFLATPTKAEVQDIRTGALSLALLPYRSVLFLLYQFGRMPWSDAAYSVHLTEQADLPVRSTQELPPALDSPDNRTYRALLNILLVDAATGILRALRTVSMSPEFTRRLHLEIRTQHAAGWPGDAAYNRDTAAAYAAWPDSAAMLAASVARCRGGE